MRFRLWLFLERLLHSVEPKLRKFELFTKGPFTDQKFGNVRDIVYKRDLRHWLEKAWQHYKQYCGDAKDFAEKIRKNFHSCTWEIDLYETLKRWGYQLLPIKKEGPDFSVDIENQTIWIEAIACEKGTGPDAFRSPHRGVNHVQEREMQLRYTAALFEKREKFSHYINEKLVEATHCCVIALNAGDLEEADIDAGPIPRIARVLYPFGDQMFYVPIENSGPVEAFYPHEAAIQKRNKSEVPTDLFMRPEFNSISAVIFSPRDIFNRFEYKFRDQSDFLIVHNKNALNPLPNGFPSFARHFRMNEEGFYEEILPETGLPK